MVLADTPNKASSGHRRPCSTSPIAIDIMALMLCPSVVSTPTSMGHFYSLNAILQPLHTMSRVDVVLVAIPNQDSSGLRIRFSTATIDNDVIALMQCPSLLSAPTLMGYFHAYNAILRAPHTRRRVDVVLADTSTKASSGLRRRCSTSPIAIDIMALMLCPPLLSAPTLMGHFYSLNAILQPPHTIRR